MYQYVLYLGKTVAQVALRWLLQQKVVASVIIGASSVKQLEDNMGAASGWELSAEEVSISLFSRATINYSVYCE